MKTKIVMMLACLLATLGISFQAQAQTCEPPRILFVLDASSSMLQTVGGQTKWDHLQGAVQNVLTNHGDVAQYGLMVFPGPSGGCQTGSVRVDVGAGTGPQIETEMGSISIPVGNATPAGQSLVAASTYAGITDPSQANYVIFITDGWQYCSIDTAGAPVCATAGDCTLMNASPCPSCNACQGPSDPDPNCAGQNADGCWCVREWPVRGVEALAAQNVVTYVMGFGGEEDSQTLDQAAQAGGAALPTSPHYYQASAPADLTNALASIVQQVVTENCDGECGIPGTRTCTAAGWSDCDAPSTISCTSACGTTGVQECVNGALTPCDAVCTDAGAGGSGATGGAGGAAAGGAPGTGGSALTGGSAGTAASGGTSGTGAYAGGLYPDGGAAVGGGIPSEQSEDEGSCGCRTVSSAPRTLFGALALALALGLVVRRRR